MSQTRTRTKPMRPARSARRRTTGKRGARDSMRRGRVSKRTSRTFEDEVIGALERLRRRGTFVDPMTGMPIR
jgi:hypothetical protein